MKIRRWWEIVLADGLIRIILNNSIFENRQNVIKMSNKKDFLEIMSRSRRIDQLPEDVNLSPDDYFIVHSQKEGKAMKVKRENVAPGAEEINRIDQELQETQNMVTAIGSGEGGKAYDSLADALAQDPPIPDNVVFQTPEGIWRRDSSLSEGAEFLREFVDGEKITSDIDKLQKKFYEEIQLSVSETIPDKYFGSTGITYDSAAFDIIIFDISSMDTGDTLKIESTDNQGSAIAYGFFSSNVVSEENLIESSQSINLTPNPVEAIIPEGATHIALSKYHSATIIVSEIFISDLTVKEEIEGVTNPIKTDLDSIETDLDSVKTDLDSLKDKFTEKTKLIEAGVISSKYLLADGSLGSLGAYSLYEYDVEEYQGDKIHLKISGNAGNSRGYAFYDSDVTFDADSAIFVREGSFTSYDENMIIPPTAKKLLVVKYSTATIPDVHVYKTLDKSITEIIRDEVDSFYSRNALKEGYSVVKIDSNGEVRLLSRMNDEKAIYIHFKKCMFNELYTYYKVGYVNYSDINLTDYTFTNIDTILTTGSDNIGPLNISGNWTGGNHSYNDDSTTKTAETISVEFFADGGELNGNEEIVFCKSFQIKVENIIYDPRVAPVEGENTLSDPLAEEHVFYDVREGDVSVSLSHKYLDDATVAVYYGMQTICRLDEFLTSGGDAVTFQDRSLASPFDKSTYPNFNRWLQRSSDKSKYESVFLNTNYSIGDHSLMSGDIANTSASKLYHVLMRSHPVEVNEVYSWSGTYSWKLPVSETSDYICFIYSVNGSIFIVINVFNSFSGFVLVDREMLSPLELISATTGITLESNTIEPMGVKISASNPGFINIKITQ